LLDAIESRKLSSDNHEERSEAGLHSNINPVLLYSRSADVMIKAPQDDQVRQQANNSRALYGIICCGVNMSVLLQGCCR